MPKQNGVYLQTFAQLMKSNYDVFSQNNTKGEKLKCLINYLCVMMRKVKQGWPLDK
jgi:hypothetical protein